MFKLVKTDTVTRNRFKLRIQLRFLDRSPSEIFESPVFRCRTKKNEKGKVLFRLVSIPSYFSKSLKDFALSLEMMVV